MWLEGLWLVRKTTTTTEVQNGGGIYRGLTSILESE